MRYPIIIGLVLLVLLLFVWGRNFQAPTHVSNKAYDLMLSTLLSHSVPEVSVERVASGHFRVLDAREQREFEVSHLAGAIWVGYSDFTLDRLAGIDTQAPVAVYCSVGYRSERIAEQLRQQGYTNVVNIYGGLFEWVNAGYPIVTGDGTETETIHAYSKLWGIWLNRGARIYE